jgi:hypothetical protein
MKKILVSFSDVFEFEDNATQYEIYDTVLKYLAECVKWEDVTAFEFKEEKNND